MGKNIIFMGTPSYATVIFEELIKNGYNIVALFTQPDKKVGRKQVITPPHIKQFVLDHGLSLPIYQPNKLKENGSVDIIKKLAPDYIIVAAYGQILSQDILDIAPCINLHASLLPLYRGASPIQQALLNDDTFTGVTAMLMELGLDSGDILGYNYIKITKEMDIGYLFDTLAQMAAKLSIDVLEKFENLNPKQQNNALVSYCSKITKKDGEVEFDNAYKIFLKYKAYKFWPGIFLKSGLKLLKLDLYEKNSVNIQGEILQIEKNYIIVGCTQGSIKIETIQQPSKKAISVGDYIRGQRLQIGNIIS